MKKRGIVTLSIVGGIVIALTIGFFTYTGIYYHCEDVSSYLVSSDKVEVKKQKNDYFFISKENKNIGYIFYPGAKVEAKSYAPILYTLAENGINTYLVDMPFNLAFFDIDKADSIIKNNDKITTWYLGGHSLGGAMSCVYAQKNSDKLTGMILFASYSSKDLSKTNLKVLTIYGSNDQVLNKNKVNDNSKFLPSDNQVVVIDGGIHSYFGHYGHQKKDGTGSISRNEFEEKVIDSVKEFVLD